MCGRIWAIDQTLHSFWLDVERPLGSSERMAWSLYVDVDVASVGARRARDAVDTIDEPGEVAWLVTLQGGA